MDDQTATITTFILDKLDLLGAFSLVVLVMGLFIWFLMGQVKLKDSKIDEKDNDLKEHSQKMHSSIEKNIETLGGLRQTLMIIKEKLG